MADRKVSIDIEATDSTARGFDSAANRAKRTSDQIDRYLEAAGESGGQKMGDRIAARLAGAANSIGSVALAVGSKSGARLADGIAGSLANSGPQVQGALLGVATAAVATIAPLLGAATAGAVMGGAAGAGIIGGVVLASRDSRVQAAATRLGTTLSESLARRGTVFVRPVLDAIEMIESRWNRFVPIIQRVMNQAARYVEPLTDALLTAAESIGEGFADAVEQSGPVIDSVARGIVQLGQTIGQTLTAFSALGPEAASAFDVVFTVIDKTIFVVGRLIYHLGWLWGQITTLGGLLGDDAAGMEPFSEAIEDVGSAASMTAPAVTGLTTALTGLGAAQQFVGASYATSIEGLMNLDRAQINHKAAVEAVTQAKEKGVGVTNNEAQAVLALAERTQNLASEYSKTGVQGDALRAKQQDLYNQFVTSATQIGYTADQARELARRYGLVPPKVFTKVEAPGAEQAITNIREVERAANRADGRTIDIAIRVTRSGASPAAIAAALNKQNYAADAAGVFAMGAAQFAAGRSFASIARGAEMPRSQKVSVSSRVKVELDGRALSPEVVRVTTRVIGDQAWRRDVGRRDG